MCICINCKHIKNCKTYYFIEKQHHVTLFQNYNAHTFIPNNTIMQINLKKYMNTYILDWDLTECTSFIEQPGSWIKKYK